MLKYPHMRASNLFTKTRQTAPADEVAKTPTTDKAGYVYKEMVGAYAYLPLAYVS